MTERSERAEVDEETIHRPERPPPKTRITAPASKYPLGSKKIERNVFDLFALM